MTGQDWTTLIFMSSILWIIVPTMAAAVKWDDLTRRENQAGMAIDRKEFTPPMARQVVWRYVWVAILSIFWPLTFVGAILFCVFYVLRAGGAVLILAMKRS